MREIDEIAAQLRSEGKLTLANMVHTEPKIIKSRSLVQAAITECIEDLASKPQFNVETAALAVLEDIDTQLHDRYTELKPVVARVVAYCNRSLGGSPPPIYDESEFPVEFGDIGPSGNSEFLLLERVGAGYHGDVFRAVWRSHPDPAYHRIVALKVLNPLGHITVSGIDLRTESAVASLVQSPNVIATEGFVSTASGQQAVIYEFVKGGSLHKKFSPPIPVSSAAKIAMQAARGLADIHAKGALHCDIDSTNIMVDEHGVVRIADLGLAVLKSAETIHGPGLSQPIGAASFVSDEQFKHGRKAASAQSDIYALGGVLYWLLTGQLWNDLPRCFDRWAGHSSVPIPVRRIVDRALHREPASRHEAAAMLADDLQNWLTNRPIEWQRAGVVARTRLAIARRPKTSVLVGSSAFAVLIMSAVSIAIGIDRETDRRTLEAQNAIRDELSNVAAARQSARRVMTMSLGKWSAAEVPSRATMYNFAAEHMFGPVIWNDADKLAWAFENRAALTRDRLKFAPQGSVESRIFRTSLAEFLAQSGDSSEARQLVASLHIEYSAITFPEDPIFTKLEHIDAAAAMNAIPGDGSGEMNAMLAVADRLEQLMLFRGNSADNWYLKHDVASRLEVLYGPGYLDDRERLSDIQPVLGRLRAMAELETQTPFQRPDPVHIGEGLEADQADALMAITNEWLDLMALRSPSLFEQRMLARGGEPGKFWNKISADDKPWAAFRFIHADRITIQRPPIAPDGIVVMRPIAEGGAVRRMPSLFRFDPMPAKGAAYVGRQVCMPVTLVTGAAALLKLEYEWIEADAKWVPRKLFVVHDQGIPVPSRFIF